MRYLMAMGMLMFCLNTYAGEKIELTVEKTESGSITSFIINEEGQDEMIVSKVQYDKLNNIEKIMDDETLKIRLTPKKKCYCFQCGNNANTKVNGCSRLGRAKAMMNASAKCALAGQKPSLTYIGAGKCK